MAPIIVDALIITAIASVVLLAWWLAFGYW
jgi:hypothetical protein